MSREDIVALPTSCDVAFKEWAGVCDALLSGRQSIILRKGGIAEGPRGFVPEHPAFWLYPTWTHQAAQGLLDPVPSPPAQTNRVPIEGLAMVERLIRVEREEDLDRLAGLHRLRPETVWQRFHYRAPGLWILLVRAYRRPEPAWLDVTPEQEGCKTWVPLAAPLSTAGLEPVLGDEDAGDRARRLEHALPHLVDANPGA